MAGPGASQTLRLHWPHYLAEAGGLMAFMLGAGSFTTLFMYAGSPAHDALPGDLVRRVCLGLCMAAVTAMIVYSPWGHRSGAHINPAVTWSFYRIGRISGWDALFYTAFQFAGAVIAPVLLLAAIGSPFTAPHVDYAMSLPGPPGPIVALVAEFFISAILMLTVLVMVSLPALRKGAGAAIALLVALYIAFESPLSGMSLNPARSFGSALTARHWDDLWVYFVAPPLAMLLAAEAFVGLCRRFPALRAGPTYPMPPQPKEPAND